MNISLPFRSTTITVHLDQPRHFGFLCTCADEEIGILYKNGILRTFEPSEYSPPIEWEKTTYTPPFDGWWLDEYEEKIRNFVSVEMMQMRNRPIRYD